MYLRFSTQSGLRRTALVFLLGVLATGAMPPLHGVFLLIPALTGFLWLLFSLNTRRSAFFLGWWFGLGHFASGLYWIANALLVQAEQYGAFAPFAVLGLAALLAIFTGLVGLATYMIGKRSSSMGRVLLFAALWTLFEWVRSWIFTGFPWNLMGSVWTFSDAMIQPTAWVSVYGLSLLTVFCAALPATLAHYAEWRMKGNPLMAVSLAAIGLILIWAGGTYRLSTASDVAVPDVRLRLVQPNIEQRLKWKHEYRQPNLEEQARMGAQPPANGEKPPTHIIWAETAATFFLTHDNPRRQIIARATPENGLTITGAPRAMPRTADKYRVWNSLHAIDASAEIVGTFDKFHLVPFGEYMPFRNLIGLNKLTAGTTDFSPGEGPKTLMLKGLPPVSPLICYEVIFPAQVANKGERPEWLLNLTNDGWYGVSSGPYQHFAAARLRAVEEGLPLVRVANTGISGVIDGYGRIVAKLGLSEKNILDSHLPKALPQTLYGRYGNPIPLTIIVFMVLIGVLLRKVIPRS